MLPSQWRRRILNMARPDVGRQSHARQNRKIETLNACKSYGAHYSRLKYQNASFVVTLVTISRFIRVHDL